MRLDFNVLWVDDQSVDAQVKAIRRGMEEHGFNFAPTQCRTMEDVQKFIAGDGNVFTDEVDLILVDWDLGGGLKGQDVIAKLRDTIRYKDIVFYSSGPEVDTLRELAFKNGVEGVFCASKMGLVDEVLEIFEAIVKKVLDLDHTRGIVMGATSDIDNMVNACLSIIHSGSSEMEQHALVVKANERIEASIARFDEGVKKLGNPRSFAAMLKAHELLKANDRLRVLYEAMKNKKFDGHEILRSSLNAYLQEVVPSRNVLGHQVLVRDIKSGNYVDAKGKDISIEEMRKLRCTLLDIRSEFRKFLDALENPT